MPIGTVSITTLIHADAATLAAQGMRPMLACARGVSFAQGFLEQRAEVWGEEGRLLAGSIQAACDRDRPAPRAPMRRGNNSCLHACELGYSRTLATRLRGYDSSSKEKVAMCRTTPRSASLQTGSALASWAILLASVGFVALAALNLLRG